MKRSASAVWTGNLKEGSGHFGVASGAIENQHYSHKLRFENEDGMQGTNPEELIAAAHSSCFAMQFAAYLADAGHPAERIDTTAIVTLVPGTGITGSHLVVKAKVPGISNETFMSEAERAKETCPVSKALGAIEVTLEAELAG